MNTAVKEIEDTFDEVLISMAHDFGKAQSLQKVNADLSSEIEKLRIELDNRHKQLLQKDDDIVTLNNKVRHLIDQQNSLVQEIDKEMSARALLIKTNYDVSTNISALK